MNINFKSTKIHFCWIDSDIRMEFPSMESLIDWAFPRGIFIFWAGEKPDELKTFALGELFYHGDRAFVIYTIPGLPVVRKDAQEFDFIINPFLKKIVFDKEFHMRLTSPVLHSQTSRNGLTSNYPLLQLIVKCIREKGELIEWNDGKGTVKGMAIGKKEGDAIVFHTGRKVLPGEEIEFAIGKIKYENIIWFFDPEDVRFFY